MLTNDSKLAEQADAGSRQLLALRYSAISSNAKTVSVVSRLQFTHASRSSQSWLAKQPQLLVASLSCPELGTAQPQLVSHYFMLIYCQLNAGSPVQGLRSACPGIPHQAELYSGENIALDLNLMMFCVFDLIQEDFPRGFRQTSRTF